jgi:hypothetical protein
MARSTVRFEIDQAGNDQLVAALGAGLDDVLLT